jgi:hypothetical protein
MVAPDDHPVRAPVGYLFATRGGRRGKHLVFTYDTPGQTPYLTLPCPDPIPAILCASEQRKWPGEPSHTMDTIAGRWYSKSVGRCTPAHRLYNLCCRALQRIDSSMNLSSTARWCNWANHRALPAQR